MPTTNQIRQQFLDFFAQRGRTVVPSASLIPKDDPTLLFTNAGMNQFKDIFLGTGSRPYVRATNSQKCLRVSGKHNDLEEVGRDTYHHTFFEMLGNWSFGDYYKKEAISWAWELLTDVWKLPKDRLYATVYKTDDEAAQLWAKVTDINPDHILRFAEKENFWEMGDVGPCGPCSEIHIDLGPDRCDKADVPGHQCHVNGDCSRYIELWNLVFIQYNRLPDGSLVDLPNKHVDTGMGFERIAAVLQGKRSNYDIDSFAALIAAIERATGRKYADPANVVAMRAIADHVRTLTFTIADGALPGNEGRSYVLRRILRRAARFGRTLGQVNPFLYKLVPDLTAVMGDAYPEIRERQAHCIQVIKAEEEGFGRTLDKGIELFEEIAVKLQQQGQNIISGSDAFKLYDTFGFPLDLTELMAREHGLTVDLEGFNREMEQQRERARSAGRFTRDDAEVHWHSMNSSDDQECSFVGYDTLKVKSAVLGWGEAPDHYRLITAQTPFYAEMGGQVGDTGFVEFGGHRHRVTGTHRDGSRIVHSIERPANEQMPMPAPQECLLSVDPKRRLAIASHHTATHLLHAALRTVLGGHVNQAGSLVAPDRLRFDFTHFEKVSTEQLRAIEQLVNEQISAAKAVETSETSYDEAVAQGATALFGEKYGDQVRAVRVPDFSHELCGGTHVRNTAQIQYFRILNESSIATGVRRIEAVAGQAAIKVAELERTALAKTAALLKADVEHVPDRVEALLADLAKAARDAKSAAQARAGAQAAELLENVQQINGVNLLVARMDGLSADLLREAVDRFKSSYSPGIVLLGGLVEDKPFFVAGVTKDMTAKVQAGAIVKEAAAITGGGGGGRPDMAQAGGKDAAKLDEALTRGKNLITGKLN